jgi:hypothetical protein
MADKKRRGIWSFIYPILIYWLVETLASSVVLTVKVMKSLNGIEDTVTYEQLQEMVLTTATNMTGNVYYASMLLASVVLIPLFTWMYRKDENARKLTLTQDEIVRRPPRPITCYLFPILLTGAAVIVGNSFITISQISLQSEAFQETQSILYGGDLLLEVLGAGIVIPILEELLFRLVIYQRMKERYPVIWSLVFNVLLFGILHGNLVQGIYGGIMGAIFCYGLERYQKAVVPILMHCFGNLLALGISYTGIADILFGNMIAAYSSAVISALILVAAVYWIEVKMVVQSGENR